MTRDESNRLPENLVRKVLARAAELDAVDRVSVSIPDLRSAAVEAGISQRALDQALSEVEAMQSVPPESAHETKAAPRFKRRFIAAVAVIAILIVLIGTMTMVVPNTVVVSSEEVPVEIEIPQPPAPPPPPPLPGR